MSLLISESYANTTTPLWVSADSVGPTSSTPYAYIGGGLISPFTADNQARLAFLAATGITQDIDIVYEASVDANVAVIRTAGVYKIDLDCEAELTSVSPQDNIEIGLGLSYNLNTTFGLSQNISTNLIAPLPHSGNTSAALSRSLIASLSVGDKLGVLVYQSGDFTNTAFPKAFINIVKIA